MNCDWLKTATAFDCVPVRGLHGERGVEIGTPFSYADGSAIVLYALEEGDRILLSDNGEMLTHLQAIGVPVGRRVAALRDRVARFGVTLGDQGDIRVLVPAEQGAHMLATAISGLLSVAEWEREQVGLDEQTQNPAEEAEILLREWKPGATLERRPKIKVQSKREHTFAFLMDGEYIDVIPANHTATGATMRKAGDVKNSPYLVGREIRVVIDDRRDPDRADVERQILGSLVRAMTLTKLQRLAKPGPVQQVAVLRSRNTNARAITRDLSRKGRSNGRVSNGATHGATTKFCQSRTLMNAGSAPDWEVMIDHM